MRLAPKSLGGRLILGAAVLTFAALVVAGGAIGYILNRFVVHQLEERLDQQTATISAALTRGEDGKLSLSRNVDGPPFDRPRSGWYWRATSGDVELKSASLDRDKLDVGPAPGPRPPWARDVEWDWDWRHGWGGGPPSWRRPRSGEATGPEGAALLTRTTSVDVGGKPAEIVVAAPWIAAAGPTRAAIAPLALSLLLLGLILAGASWLQVRLGLKPLRALQAAVGEVRAGRAPKVPADQPSELQPLAQELNALIDNHATGLASARLHVANLAHGLKTPLATLAVALAEPGRDPDGALSAEIDRVERRIRHHLARARAAALRGPARTRTPLRPRIDDLSAALARIHAGRAVEVENRVDQAIAVACDPQDVDEVVGNLLDNAFKWAGARVAVSSAADGQSLTLTIEDDGPGLPEADLAEAIRPGRRLDESVPGHGFGLSITRELAELYGGGLSLANAAGGGLEARLTLPAAL